MPNVFNRNILANMPAGASIEAKGGKRTARWNEGGRTRKAGVATTRDGDRIITGESDTWYGKLRIGKRPHHQWKTVTLFTDKTASERELAKMQTAEDQRAAGVVTVEMDQAAKPISVHAADYLAAMKQSGVADDHHRIASWMLNRFIELSGWARMSDITADSLRSVVTKLTAAEHSTSYVNKFISRAKAFVHWMQAEGRTSGDPLKGVKRGNVKRGKRTRSRRAMAENELRALLAAAPVSRRQKYLFAALSGLRRGELTDLRWNDLRLNSPIPFIQLREDQTKNEKADAIPLHPALVRVLNGLPEPTTDGRVFGPMPDMKTMARDLLKAGLATLTDDPKAGVRIDKGKYVSIADARGRRTDFHALRHTFKTAVDRTGCTEATSDALTRHGDKTIGDGYRHAELADMLEALRKIPDPSPEGIAGGTEAAAATGTTDSAPADRQSGAHHRAHQTSGGERQTLATIGNNSQNAPAADTACGAAQLPYNATVGGSRQQKATIGDKSIIDNNLRPSTQVD